MSEEHIEYNVNWKGEVINLKSLEGDSYKVKSEIVTDYLPPKAFIGSRWYDFKQLVINQPRGVWVKYTGWLDKTELKYAHQTVNRKKKDKTLKNKIGDNFVETRQDGKELILYVKIHP